LGWFYLQDEEDLISAPPKGIKGLLLKSTPKQSHGISHGMPDHMPENLLLHPGVSGAIAELSREAGILG
jgi:hypothetical protein